MKRLLIGCVVAAVLSGCASSSVVVGTVRAPIDPEQVRLYVEPPPHFENVALLQASSEASFALTQQQKSNKTIDRMKQEAADLGANGILLQGVGKEYAGSIGSGYAWGSRGSAWGLGSSAAMYNQAGAGMAIYVYPGSETVPSPLPPAVTRGDIETNESAAMDQPSTPSTEAAQPGAPPAQSTPQPQPQESGQMRWKPRGL
ncbi:hypothetical protein [Luteimonas cellulosilyticus]|uniref:hypothetical protein n=1 Tax=Luteimonas cellulosilyticus TaxID=2683586 RepID=UPI00117E951F|nr:hypothetical protein [Luteimonas cellulosilyticus]